MVKGTDEQTMLKTAQKINLSSAIEKFTSMLEEGVFNKTGICYIIFLKNTAEDGSRLLLTCNREIGTSNLSLFVGKIDLYSVWSGSGIYYLV